jgi:hypothetical protein
MKFIRLRTPESPSERAKFAYWKPIVEAVFRVASWCVLLAGLLYFSKKSGSDYLLAAYGVLFALLCIYVFSWFLSTIELDVIPKNKRTRFWHWVIDAAVNGLLTYGMYWGLQKVIVKSVEAVAAAQGIQ